MQVTQAAITDAQARSEVRRYIVMPGQACAYKIGELRIRALRAHAEQTLGDKFNIRDFHDQVLASGNLALPMLAEKIEHWLRHGSWDRAEDTPT